jgi:hypothetical protein
MSYPYQNQPGYPPPYPPPPPPRKSNTGLIIALAAFAAVAVIALVVVLVVKGGDDKSSNSPGSANGSNGSSGSADTGDSTGSAEALGKKATQLIQSHDADGAGPLLCKAESKFPRSVKSLDGKDITATYKSVNETGDTAEVTFTLAMDGKSRDQKINLAKKNDKWCIN